jgi:outer membrane protein OmpA-like peptidoglycan-associated protein
MVNWNDFLILAQWRKLCRCGIAIGLCCGLLLPTFANSQTRELPIGADYCAILRAFTNANDPKCPNDAAAGMTRSTGAAATTGFDKAAASLSSSGEENGYYIRFAFNSVQLTQEYKTHLDRLSSVFRSAAMDGVCIKLMGHTDITGAPEYNKRLSFARAKMVEVYLVSSSAIDAGRIVSDGLGEGRPLQNIPGGHPLNRRVEILARAKTGSLCSEG